MATVRELFKKMRAIGDNCKAPVMVNDENGAYIPLVQSFYVEDDTLFLFTKSDKNTPLTVDYLRFYLENEAADECWDVCCGESSFLDCDVNIVFGAWDDAWDDDSEHLESVFDVYCFVGSNTQLSCICDYNNDESDDESDENVIRNITLQLSTEEVDMICESLNYYGDKVADSVGYSAGEKYWDLVSIIKA